MNHFVLGIVGATGLVGRTILRVMEERDIRPTQLYLFASKNSAGKTLTFNGEEYAVKDVAESINIKMDYAIFSAGASVAKQYAHRLVQNGCIVIDNSSAFRMDKNVSLIVPEVNWDDLNLSNGIIANPNCSTIQCMSPLKVVNEMFGITSVIYNTYQSVSGAGKRGLDDLERTRAGETPEYFPHNISENCLVQIGEFFDDGYTQEEMKMESETKKILSLTAPVTATCVRVPCKYCHLVNIYVTTQKPIDLAKLRKKLTRQAGVRLIDGKTAFPYNELAHGKDEIYVGRLRTHHNNPCGLHISCVADNLRKGASTNAVQILEKLIQKSTT